MCGEPRAPSVLIVLRVQPLKPTLLRAVCPPVWSLADRTWSRGRLRCLRAILLEVPLPSTVIASPSFFSWVPLGIFSGCLRMVLPVVTRASACSFAFFCPSFCSPAIQPCLQKSKGLHWERIMKYFVGNWEVTLFITEKYYLSLVNKIAPGFFIMPPCISRKYLSLKKCPSLVSSKNGILIV